MPSLDPKAVAKLETLPLRAKVIVEGALSGLHRARLHGSSVEFSEHKEYAPGDELRHLDWKVFGKADRYYIKRFEQESELTAHLIVDASGSMGYGGRGVDKLTYAAHLAAALAHLLIRQQDRVGLRIFGKADEIGYVPPRARTSHLTDLFTTLDRVLARGAAGDDSLGGALERTAEVARRQRGLVVAISDFFDRDPRSLDVLAHLRARGNDVVALQVLDRDELDLPFDGLTIFESLESPRRLLAQPSAIRRQYHEKLRAFLDRIRGGCLASGVDYIRATTDTPFEETLLSFLTRTERGVKESA